MKGVGSLITVGIAQVAVCALFASIVPKVAAQGQSRSRSHSASNQEYADDTLIITLTPGADMDKVKDELNEVHGTVTKTLHIDAGNYSILFVKPENGKCGETIKKINEKKDKNFKSISRNQILHSSGIALPAPTDPYFSDQWNLHHIHWVEARNTYGNRQIVAPQMVDIDSGIQPINEGNELNLIKQFDCIKTDVPTPEIPFDDMDNYSSAPGHGTACNDMYGAVTDNAVDTAGVASFRANIRPRMYEFRSLNKNDNATTKSLVLALSYIANNKAALGGACPVNISIEQSGKPLWVQSPFAELAQSLYLQGSLAVFCAGDFGTDLSQYPPGYGRVVQGTDQADKLGTGSYASCYIGNNMPAAPGYNVPLIWGNHQLLSSDGTSFASPTWAACIAVLQSIKPQLTAPQADQIVLSTATQITVNSPPPGGATSSYTLRLPNLLQAVAAIAN